MIIPTEVIGTPYSEKDCRQIALLALDLAGVAVPSREAWEAASIDLGEEHFREIVRDTEEHWLCLHDRKAGAVPTSLELKDGDVLVSKPLLPTAEGVIRRLHLSVVCDPRGRMALTTSEKMGAAIYRVGLLGPASVFRIRR